MVASILIGGVNGHPLSGFLQQRGNNIAERVAHSAESMEMPRCRSSRLLDIQLPSFVIREDKALNSLARSVSSTAFTAQRFLAFASLHLSFDKHCYERHVRTMYGFLWIWFIRLHEPQLCCREEDGCKVASFK